MEQSMCGVVGCDRPARSRSAELCNTHYFRVRRTGEVGEATIALKGQPKQPCEVEGCSAETHSLGLCDRHYQRLRNHGDTNWVTPRTGRYNCSWRGQLVGYTDAHDRVRSLHGSSRQYLCSCGAPARHWAYDHTDPDEITDHRGQKYSGDPAHYRAMCVPCHKRFDLDHLALIRATPQVGSQGQAARPPESASQRDAPESDTTHRYNGHSDSN